jgi:hypothetical protein
MVVEPVCNVLQFSMQLQQLQNACFEHVKHILETILKNKVLPPPPPPFRKKIIVASELFDRSSSGALGASWTWAATRRCVPLHLY